MVDSPSTNGRAAARYASGFAEREPYLVRARRISKLTVPSLFREWGATGISDDVTPWQSLGAYGVNNLSAKLVLAMFPPGIPFISIKQDRKALAGLNDIPDPDQRGKLKALIDKGLSKVEMEFIEAIEEDGDRAMLFDTARHMVVGGNHALGVEDDGSLRGYPLETYCTWRDRAGNLVEFCIEESLAYHSLPDDVQALVDRQGYGPVEGADNANKGKAPGPTDNWTIKDPLWEPLKVYTHGELKGGMWWVYTEVMSLVVPNSMHPYNREVLPYLFLRMVALKNEPYGRSYCEDYEGDLQTYDAVWQAFTEGGAMLAKVITLIKPGSNTSKEVYAKSANGAVIAGEEGDVHVVQANKGGDLSFVFQEATQIEKRLQLIFILNSAVERQGERVTATEITLKSQELDTTLGGVYSNQVTTWQKPYAELKMAALQRKGRMTKLPKGTTKVTILTGDAGLGRGKKAQDIIQFLQTLVELFPNDAAAPYVSISNAAERLGANMFVDTDGLIHSEEEVQQQEQQQRMDQMATAAAPQVAQQAGQMIQNTQQASIAQAQPQDSPPQDPSSSPQQGQ